MSLRVRWAKFRIAQIKKKAIKEKGIKVAQGYTAHSWDVYVPGKLRDALYKHRKTVYDAMFKGAKFGTDITNTGLNAKKLPREQSLSDYDFANKSRASVPDKHIETMPTTVTVNGKEQPIVLYNGLYTHPVHLGASRAAILLGLITEQEAKDFIEEHRREYVPPKLGGIV